MVTAAGASLLPAGMGDDEIMIDQWLADDLQARPGDALRLTYYVPGATHRLEEKQGQFRIHSVAPMEGMAADRTLMPDFPGIARAEKTENWDAGFAIDLQKIRPKDEQYWKQYRGTPKAFVTLSAGRRMWGNRFGDVTALRFATGRASEQSIQQGMASALDPAAIGFVFQPLRERALAASRPGGGFWRTLSWLQLLPHRRRPHSSGASLPIRTGKAGGGNWHPAGRGLASAAGAPYVPFGRIGHRHSGGVVGRGGRRSLREGDFVGAGHAVAVRRGRFVLALPRHRRESGRRRGRRRYCQYYCHPPCLARPGRAARPRTARTGL